MRFVWLLALTGCVNSAATPLAEVGAVQGQRPPTCWQAVSVYASREAIGAAFVEVALVTASSADPATDDMLIRRMRERAAKAGANGLLVQHITGTTSGVGLLGVFAGQRSEAKGLALWVPRDSLRAVDDCLKAARAARCADLITRPADCPR